MAAHPPLSQLCAALGVEIGAARLEEALTHSSAASPARPDYQRLEFLGDRVLMLVIAEALMACWPDAPEGALAPRLNALVCKESCAEVAQALDLGAYLRMDRSEAKAGGRNRLTILGDAMEAVIAAIYLDQGLETARAAVLRLWAPIFERVQAAPREPKSALQEWAEGRGMDKPVYELRDRAGPDHRPRFTVAARLADGREAVATGPSKRAAEKDAAEALLKRVEHE